ncbi:hypothetical protein [Flavobacterium terrigena]|uniref:Uncharacterized protein n=1 Tax=Flavobacterium terrigena TaxID=402734 RepID=A0A1H6S6W7_9FLAO|nr:hypothetical protein [Flavobacterium terrigena]SEI63701.1 hypothetical protein SAMN05660918_1233 [Flavobacterium terrigena]
MKTILTIWNTSNKGKSSTILELANLLLRTFPKHTIIYTSKDIFKLSVDFRLIIEINGKIIALESQGDPGTGLEKRLNNIITLHKPYLIITSSRTRGETIWAINNVADLHKYDKIWTSTYETSHSHKLANELKAEHLLDLIKKLGLI